MTAWVTGSPRYSSASRFIFCRIMAEISWGVKLLSSIRTLWSVPIFRFIEMIVRSALTMACRFASWPTRRSPSLEKATTEGVRRLPSALGMTVMPSPSLTAMTLFVVPRSMPTIFAMIDPAFRKGRNSGPESSPAAPRADSYPPPKRTSGVKGASVPGEISRLGPPGPGSPSGPSRPEPIPAPAPPPRCRPGPGPPRRPSRRPRAGPDRRGSRRRRPLQGPGS